MAHRHEFDQVTTDRSLERWINRVGIALVVASVVGLIALWPRGSAPDLGIPNRDHVDATVDAVESTTCPGIDLSDLGPCRLVTVTLTSGPDDGKSADVQISATQFNVPDIEVGDSIVLLHVPTAPEDYRYTFFDFQRGFPLVWLLVAFAMVVIVFGRLQGVRALIGLAASILLLVAFVVPALVRGEPALLVALTATTAIGCLAIYLAHGFNTSSTVALLGTTLSVFAIAGLSYAVTIVAHLSGLASEDAQVLRVTADAVDLRGLLVAGIVIGALGTLDDVTVTQVSTVAALRRANPDLGGRALYAEAVVVGRDHVASTVNTLVLAYAGAGLPLLLFLAQGTTPVGRILTGELIATEIVRALVGSIGLIASVPITTALAAAVASRAPVRPRARPTGPARWEDFSPDDDPDV